jgi:hypothetical protein
MALSQKNAIIVVVVLALLGGAYALTVAGSGATGRQAPSTHADTREADRCTHHGGMWHPDGGKGGGGYCMK